MESFLYLAISILDCFDQTWNYICFQFVGIEITKHVAIHFQGRRKYSMFIK